MSGLHHTAIFPGVEEPCGCGGAYDKGGKVTRWSQSALCATAVCSDSVYSWLDALQVARTLTCIGGNTVSSGVEDPCGACCMGGSYPGGASQHCVHCGMIR